MKDEAFVARVIGVGIIVGTGGSEATIGDH